MNLAKRIIRLLTRESQRGSMCEPCGVCPACKGVERVLELASDELEREAEARRAALTPLGSLCRHCRKPFPGSVGIPDAVCPNCGKRAIDPEVRT